MKLTTTLRSQPTAAGIFSLLFAFSIHARAQLALPLDKGLPGRVYASCTDSNNLYVMYHATPDSATSYDTCAIAKWNGIFWSYYPKFVIHSDSQKYCMALYNKQIYIGGYFDSIIGVPNSFQIFRWDGLKYSSVGSGVKSKGTRINSMVVYKNKLYVAGNFKGIGNATTANKIAGWDTSWSYLGASASFQGIMNQNNSTTVLNLAVSGGLLYVMGQFDSVSNLKGGISNIIAWSGTTWNTVSTGHGFLQILAGTVYGGKLTVSGKDSSGAYSVRQYTGSTWTKIGGLSAMPLVSLITFNNVLWAGNWELLYYSGGKWKNFKTVYPNAKFYATSKNLYITGNFTLINNKTNIASYAAGIYFNSIYLTGKAYNDLNANCKFDKGDIPLDGRLIQVSTPAKATPYYVNTDQNGDYNIQIPVDSISTVVRIQPVPKNHTTLTCLVADTLVLPADTIVANLDFAAKLDTAFTDLRVKIHPADDARIGTKQDYLINYKNVGGRFISSEFIVLTYDSAGLPNFSSTPSLSFSAGNKIGWKIKNLAPGASGNITFSLDIPRTDSIGTPLKFTIRADSILKLIDSDPTDNFDTLIQRATNSHDPNGKTVSPSGLIASNTSKLNYSIHFQNTGTGKAYKVVVIDTLDTNLPMTKVVINSASHKYSLAVKNNVLIWSFSNINLADSTSDAEHSTGHCSFTAYIKSGLAIGTEIKNRAYIYFDYNDPMHTNETLDKLGLLTGTDENNYIINNMKIYPNPANTTLIIENSGTQSESYTLINDLGQSLERIKLHSFENYKLNTGNYANGLYILRSEGGEGVKIIIRH